MSSAAASVELANFRSFRSATVTSRFSGHLLRELRVDRLEPEPDDLGGVGQVEDQVLLVPVEEEAVGLERGAAEELLERARVHDRLDDRLHHGRPATRSVDPRSTMLTTISRLTTWRTSSSWSASTEWSAKESGSTISARA